MSERWDQVFGVWNKALDDWRERDFRASEWEKLRQHQMAMQDDEQGWRQQEMDRQFDEGKRRFTIGQENWQKEFGLNEDTAYFNRGLMASEMALKEDQWGLNSDAIRQNMKESAWRFQGEKTDRERAEGYLVGRGDLAEAFRTGVTPYERLEGYNAVMARIKDRALRGMLSDVSTPLYANAYRGLANRADRPETITQTDDPIFGPQELRGRAGRLRQWESDVLGNVPFVGSFLNALVPTKTVTRNTEPFYKWDERAKAFENPQVSPNINGLKSKYLTDTPPDEREMKGFWQ